MLRRRRRRRHVYPGPGVTAFETRLLEKAPKTPSVRRFIKEFTALGVSIPPTFERYFVDRFMIALLFSLSNLLNSCAVVEIYSTSFSFFFLYVGIMLVYSVIFAC